MGKIYNCGLFGAAARKIDESVFPEYTAASLILGIISRERNPSYHKDHINYYIKLLKAPGARAEFDEDEVISMISQDWGAQ